MKYYGDSKLLRHSIFSTAGSVGNGETQKMAGEGAGKSAGEIRGAGGCAGQGAAPTPFQGKPPSQPPCQHSLQHPESPQHSSQHPPQPFSGFPRFYSLAGQAVRKCGTHKTCLSRLQFVDIKATLCYSIGCVCTKIRLLRKGLVMKGLLRAPALKIEQKKEKN